MSNAKILDWACIIIAALCLIQGINTDSPSWFVTGILFGMIALFLDVLDHLDESIDKEISADLKRDEDERRSRSAPEFEIEEKDEDHSDKQ